MREIVSDRAQTGGMLYQAQVMKRTGALAASAHHSTDIGGILHDRWVGVMTAGGIGPRGGVDYAASHEFGTDFVDAAHDMNVVLDELGYF